MGHRAPGGPDQTFLEGMLDDASTDDEAVAADVTLLTFACPAGAEAERYRVQGGGHSWPGSELLANAEAVVGRTTMPISADEIMWDFFEQHPLVEGGGNG